MEERNIGKALVAEFIGTFALVFAIILSITMYALLAGPARGLIFPFIAGAHFLVLFIMIQTLGSVSGGHFNPAITLGVLSAGRMKAKDAGLYVLVQFVGATVAALVIAACIHDPASVFHFGAPKVDRSEIGIGGGFVVEAIFTFFLVWTVMGTAVDPNGPHEWAPFAIAAALALGVLLIAPLTGAGLNPARSFGPALENVLDGGSWGNVGNWLLVYVLSPVIGGVLAARTYKMLFLDNADGDLRVSPAPSERSPL